ncbi:glutathione-dependent formaldehyde-activating GFA [Fusarium circinatum]|uniref:Glutathione-dependent formaldehyde-activating GFA n=1 Tax=Fusarium circinatum TaxID=48490 RepID=A0A8H5UE95_FUSCI|nr:glutathione-dependent formaldehyde-activating GFA [Fusarium circinatum]
MTTEQSHKAEKSFPRAGVTQDGWSTEDEATATCYCGAVQLVLVKPLRETGNPKTLTNGRQPLKKPGFAFSFVCHCSDCRKITASMFTTGIVVLDSHLKHNRGEENLKQFSPQLMQELVS